MSKLTEAARGQCCIRCGMNNGTVVAAHINGSMATKLGRGLALKPDDIFCADLCHRCHDEMDGRRPHDFDDLAPEVQEPLKASEWAEYVLLTIKRRREQGVV